MNHLAHFQAHLNISTKESSTKPSSMNIMLVNYQLQSIFSCDKHLNNSIMSDKSNNVNGFSRRIIMRIKIELYFLRIVFSQLLSCKFQHEVGIDIYLCNSYQNLDEIFNKPFLNLLPFFGCSSKLLKFFFDGCIKA